MTAPRPPLLLLALAASVLGSGCELRGGEGRARLDQEVGRATHAGIEVTVAEGLAAVHDLTATTLTLWAGAPQLTVTVRRDQAGPLAVELANALPDLRLRLQGPEGPARTIPVARTAPVPTRLSWDLQLESGTTVMTFEPDDSEDLAPWHFAVLSDVQEAVDRVGDLYRAIARDDRLRFVVSAGDLTEEGTAEQLASFVATLAELPVPLYATPGNHDTFAGADEAWARLLGRASSHFRFRGVAFSLVDSAAGSIDPLVHDLLDEWLRAAQDRPHLFVTHFAPLDPVGLRSGALRSRLEAGRLLARLAAGEVDACFYGHVHTYLPFGNAGIPAYLSGGGGAYPELFDGIGRHFLAVEVDPTTGRVSVAAIQVE